MEPDIECEEEIIIDPTRLTLKVREGILFDMGLQILCAQQQLTEEPLYVGLEDYDVVISVTKRKPEHNTIIMTSIAKAMQIHISDMNERYGRPTKKVHR